MRHWLMKSEPDEMSIDDLARARKRPPPGSACATTRRATTCATTCSSGDLAFFYHSSCPQPGIAGIVEVTKKAYPDATQFDRKSPYFDAEGDARRAALGQRRRDAAREDCRSSRSPNCATIPALAGMLLLQRGNRLSITPVTPANGRTVDATSRTRRARALNFALVPIFLALGAFVGFLAGLLGIGGGFTIVPVLVEVFPHEGIGVAHLLPLAIGTSAASIVFTAFASARAHHSAAPCCGRS